jgi:hypothetical protein
MDLTVATECLSEQRPALKDIYYQLVTINLRLIAEVLGLGLLVEYDTTSVFLSGGRGPSGRMI